MPGGRLSPHLAAQRLLALMKYASWNVHLIYVDWVALMESRRHL